MGKEEPDGVRGVSELLADGAPLPGHRRILSHAQLLHIEILLLTALGCAVYGIPMDPFPRSDSANRNYIIDGPRLRSIRDTNESFPTLNFTKQLYD
jgi:hypothetical protein